MDTAVARAVGAIRMQERHGVAWLDVENPDMGVLAMLEREYNLHPIHLTESLQNIQHSQVEREENYLFLVLHYPVLDPQSDKLLFGQVGIFLGRHYLVTIRTAASPAIGGLFEACLRDAGKQEANFKQGAGHLLHNIVRDLLAEIAAMTELVTGELDAIEDIVFDNNRSDALRIGRLRQKIVRLMRIIGPKKVVLQSLAEQVDGFMKQNLKKYYSNDVKTVNRLWEIIEEAKETVEIYKDADFTTSTEQTNGILAVLTIIFTLTIPISVIGGLYGMNVPLPGGIQTGAWTFLGPYTTFILLLALSALIALGMWLYFRRKQWF